MTLQFESIVNGPFQENCYLLYDDTTMSGVLIDPGDEPERILGIAERRSVRIEAIYNTHGHIDHAGAVSRICSSLGIPFAIHQGDKDLLAALPAQARLFGLTADVSVPQVDRWLADGDEVFVGTVRGQVLWTPGHTPGGVCFLFDNNVFVGDTLFSGSIGRTDLPGGDTQQLLGSIKNRLLSLDSDTAVHSGHGPSTRIGMERDHNPFLSRRWQLQVD